MLNKADAINYELLRTFVAAGTARTFGDAAIARRVSTSAISQQIAQLESQLGAPLFERLGRRVRLTDGGRALIDALRQELERIDAMLEATAREHETVAGRVRLGSPRTFGRHWLRPRLPPLLEKHPQLRIEVALDVPSVLERRLAAGELDLVLLVRAPELPGIESAPLYTETFVAVAQPKYLARHGTPVTAADFQAHRWVVFDRDLAMHAPWWRATFGRKAPLPARVACEIASLEEMLALAEAGAGICVLPDYHVAESVRAKRAAILEPPGAKPARNMIYLAWRSGRLEPARVRIMRDALRVD